MKRFEDIRYSAAGEVCTLDVFAPEGECRATVLWFHGGGLEGGTNKDRDGIAEQLCDAGIGFVPAEYRMYPQAKYPDFIEDAAAAAAWLVRHVKEYGLSETIFIGGSSAGAYLTMMLCFARDYLAKEGFEPEQFAGFIFNAGQPTTHFNVLKHRGEDGNLCRVDEAAPLYHVRDARPGRPILVICADNDMPARLEQNQLLHATMKHVGYDVELVRGKLMQGWAHCAYDHAQIGDRWILADLIQEFVDGVLG